jgi:hypothetical protein
MTVISDLGEAAGHVVPEREIEEVIQIDPGRARGHRTSWGSKLRALRVHRDAAAYGR